MNYYEKLQEVKMKKEKLQSELKNKAQKLQILKQEQKELNERKNYLKEAQNQINITNNKLKPYSSFIKYISNNKFEMVSYIIGLFLFYLFGRVLEIYSLQKTGQGLDVNPNYFLLGTIPCLTIGIYVRFKNEKKVIKQALEEKYNIDNINEFEKQVEKELSQVKDKTKSIETQIEKTQSEVNTILTSFTDCKQSLKQIYEDMTPLLQKTPYEEQQPKSDERQDNPGRSRKLTR